MKTLMKSAFFDVLSLGWQGGTPPPTLPTPPGLGSFRFSLAEGEDVRGGNLGVSFFWHFGSWWCWVLLVNVL